MLKKICGLFLGLVVLTGSACVTPTHASSALSVIITYIQAGGASGAKEEAITLYNPTPHDIDITDWCISNKTILFACFASELPGAMRHYTLPAYAYATVVSEEYVTAHQGVAENYSLVYGVTNNSSGSITGSSDAASLLDADGVVVDSKSWASSVATGKAWARVLVMAGPDTYATTGSPADWQISQVATLPENQVNVVEQETGSAGEESNAPPLPTNLPGIIITELLPNPAGADGGKEFIELHNPTDEAIVLETVQIRIGTSSAKWYALPTIEMAAGEYRAIYNDSIGFSLPNTAGQVQLYVGETPLGNPVIYEKPKDNQAWAIIDGEWRYTTKLTPGAANEMGETLVKEKQVKEPAPCAENQYRNPETGRCKLIATTATPTPCKPGQERNPETNRCRNIAATTAPAPCKEGYERNPETNRCRKVVKMTEAGYGVKGVEEVSDNQPSWYYWAGIVSVVAGVIGYAVWEWREELSALWRRARGLLSR